MRQLTEYEKARWFDEYGRLELDEPDFLMYGDEYGEAFQVALEATRMRDYGLSAEFVEAAKIEALTMYYDQLIWFYVEQGGDPEEHGLPSYRVAQEKWVELGLDKLDETLGYGEVTANESLMRFWDWTMEWRKKNEDTTARARRIRDLEHTLAILRGEEDGS